MYHLDVYVSAEKLVELREGEEKKTRKKERERKM